MLHTGTIKYALSISNLDPESKAMIDALSAIDSIESMSTVEKLKRASILLESVFYDLEFSKIDKSIVRGISVAEDLLSDAINILEC